MSTISTKQLKKTIQPTAFAGKRGVYGHCWAGKLCIYQGSGIGTDQGWVATIRVWQTKELQNYQRFNT